MPTPLTNGTIPNGSVLVRDGRRIVGLAIEDGPIEIVPVADADSTGFLVKPEPSGSGRKMAVMSVDGLGALMAKFDICIGLLARGISMLEQHLASGESTKEIKIEDVI